MGYLKDKIVKIKRLQKLSTSLVIVVPKNWIEEMNWDRNTNLEISWQPADEKIIIKKIEEKLTEKNDRT